MQKWSLNRMKPLEGKQTADVAFGGNECETPLGGFPDLYDRFHILSEK